MPEMLPLRFAGAGATWKTPRDRAARTIAFIEPYFTAHLCCGLGKVRNNRLAIIPSFRRGCRGGNLR